MVNSQEWLDKNYPKENRSEITELNISNKNLENDLDLSDFMNLEVLDCCRNNLTKIILPKSNLLRELNLSANKFHQDLSFLKEAVNLESLDVSANKFHGSLEYLKDMKKLWRLLNNDTDVDSGLEYLPESLEKFYCKGTKFEAKLKVCGNPTYREQDDRDYSGNYLRLLNIWKKAQQEKQIQELQKQVSQLAHQLNQREIENNYLHSQLNKVEELAEIEQQAQIEQLSLWRL